VSGGETGIVYTRTGRRFFDDTAMEEELLALLRGAMDASGFWTQLSTDWACLDCELMPWSAKAQQLIDRQYAAVGAAATSALPEAIGALGSALSRGLDVSQLGERYGERLRLAGAYESAYRRYSWPVASVSDLRLAPFHVMATEGKVHVDRDHVWHMETLASVCGSGAGNVPFATPYKVVDVTNPESEADATSWWSELTERGGEGMVVKPLPFVATGRRGLVQPALKCRGREYLRIIYGPEYTVPENLDRLRERGLSAKRSLALREFALGVESLERFTRKEPLRRVHECMFGVLALESEPVDPRL
jgi:protein phosphatase